MRIILDNIRSTYNVGAIMRTLDAVGGSEIVCCGITPYPQIAGDKRSPVVQNANTRAIAKTALGAEEQLKIVYSETALDAVTAAREGGAVAVALEQSPAAVNVFDFECPLDAELALVLGSEIEGVDPEVMRICDAIVEIPQFGSKESLNVSVAAGIALYALRRATTTRND
ncbi:MAG: TrmH family RNA methyltransferase [Solirubrobacterales bacterium]